jgi:DNA-nicking Smr family endonuclease
MTKPRRPRVLSPEERRLWAHLAREVTPMRGRTRPAEPAPQPVVPEPAPTAEPLSPRVAPASRPVIPPLAPLDRKTLVGLRRGRRAIDAVIDLHGLRQAEAHGALLAFLNRSQSAGHTVVLVITGKGGEGAGEGPFEERGVLHRVVPHWLRMADARPLVLGFEKASPHHGGSGALYVRIRRRRSGSKAT